MSRVRVGMTFGVALCLCLGVPSTMGQEVQGSGKSTHTLNEFDPNNVFRTIPCPAGPPACPLGAITADGVLDCEVKLVLDVNANGIPDILEARGGAALFQLDNINSGGDDVGADGFRDAGWNVTPLITCDQPACIDSDDDIMSTVNTGRLTVIYLRDSSGSLADGDDSVLYVGFDVFNGDSRIVGNPAGIEDKDFHVVDFLDLGTLGDVCDDGVADYDQDGDPDFCAVPFDVDGDGDSRNMGRWSGLTNCVNLPSNAVDRGEEEYRVELYACLKESGDGQFVGMIKLLAPQTPANAPLVLEFLNFAFPVPPAVIAATFTSPAAGTLTTTLGVQDVEFVINKIDTLYDSQFDGDGDGDRFNDYSIDRLKIFDGGIETLSDAQDDQSAEDKIRATWHVDAPALEVKKQIRCAGDGDPNCPVGCPLSAAGCECGTAVDALPGSKVEFVIAVENTGNVPLAVDLKDILAGVGTKLTVDAGSLKVRHIDGATGAMTMVNAANASSVKLCDQFFPPNANNFLTHVSNTSGAKPAICLGVLDGLDTCTDPNSPIENGDRVVVRFKATISSSFDFCSPKNTVDVTNSITARGDIQTDGTCAGLCPAGTSDSQFEAKDVHSTIDTSREVALGLDDNVVNINVLCRSVTFEKQVRLGTTGAFADELQMPTALASYPAIIQYRYRATNNGEADESVEFRDDPLCNDVNVVEDAVGTPAGEDVQFVAGQCELCQDPPPGAGVTKTAAANGGTADTLCQVRFDSLQAALNFMDDDSPDTDPDCYRNIATITANVVVGPDVCDGAPAIVGDPDAKICVKPCLLSITKEVRCLDNCSSGDDQFSDVDGLQVAAGACLEYRITIDNISPSVSICSLRLTDSMSNATQFSSGPSNVTIKQNGVNCGVTPAFNIAGTPISFNCVSDSDPFAPDDQIVITFQMTVRSDGGFDASKDPVNSVNVKGTTDVVGVTCAGTDDCMADDTISIDLRSCTLTVDKKVVCDSDCDNVYEPVGSPSNGPFDVVPGACIWYETVITNTGQFDLKQFCIKDDLSCRSSWTYVGASLQVFIDKTAGADQDVTADFATFLPDNNERCYTFSGGRLVAPTEKLIIRFRVSVPGQASFPPAATSCTNTLMARGVPDACLPPSTANYCSANDSVDVRVKLPELDCDKLIQVDVGADGSFEHGPSATLQLDLNPSDYPIRVKYIVVVKNTGDLDIDDICVKDAKLFADAAAAGATVVGPCDFDKDPANCTAAGSGAAFIDILTKDDGAAGGTDEATVSCTLQFTEAQWKLFALQDDGDDRCYSNTATAEGTPLAGTLCSSNPLEDVDTACAALLCVEPRTCFCPPDVKGDYLVINQDEVLHSGLCRCIHSWDEFLASSIVDAPNFFDIFFLSTNKGYARVDGIASEDCAARPEDTLDAPLLGVAVKVVDFDLGGGVMKEERSGLNMLGCGTQAGCFIISTPGGGDPLNPGGPSPEPTAALRFAKSGAGKSGPGSSGRGSTATDCLGKPGIKGSLLVYPKVEIKWNANRELIQDTFLTITNDHDTHGVDIRMYYVNGDPCRCNAIDTEGVLTKNQPTYWSAATGVPGLNKPFTPLPPFLALDPPRGIPDTDPDNPGGWVVRGYIVAWATNPAGDEIRWNELLGYANIVNYERGTVWQYDAWAFPAVAGRANGDVLIPDGVLNLDGYEYCFAPNLLLIDFYASTNPDLAPSYTSPFARTGGMPPTAVKHDTDITLLVAKKNLAEAEREPGPGGEGDPLGLPAPTDGEPGNNGNKEGAVQRP